MDRSAHGLLPLGHQDHQPGRVLELAGREDCRTQLLGPGSRLGGGRQQCWHLDREAGEPANSAEGHLQGERADAG